VKTHPDSWFAVDTILATSSSADTKFFALNVLENVICTRWMVLPESQKSGIKSLEQTKKGWCVYVCFMKKYSHLLGNEVPAKDGNKFFQATGSSRSLSPHHLTPFQLSHLFFGLYQRWTRQCETEKLLQHRSEAELVTEELILIDLFWNPYAICIQFYMCYRFKS
jgi:hypothetical protein